MEIMVQLIDISYCLSENLEQCKLLVIRFWEGKCSKKILVTHLSNMR